MVHLNPDIKQTVSDIKAQGGNPNKCDTAQEFKDLANILAGLNNPDDQQYVRDQMEEYTTVVKEMLDKKIKELEKPEEFPEIDEDLKLAKEASNNAKEKKDANMPLEHESFPSNVKLELFFPTDRYNKRQYDKENGTITVHNSNGWKSLDAKVDKDGKIIEFTEHYYGGENGNITEVTRDGDGKLISYVEVDKESGNRYYKDANGNITKTVEGKLNEFDKEGNPIEPDFKKEKNVEE